MRNEGYVRIDKILGCFPSDFHEGPVQWYKTYELLFLLQEKHNYQLLQNNHIQDTQVKNANIIYS